MTRHDPLQPATLLETMLREAAPPYRFSATDREEALAWQGSTRSSLASTLGLDALAPMYDPSAPPKAEILEVVDKGDYLRTKLLIDTTRHSKMPVYLLTPKRSEAVPPLVLAFHGHGYGVKDIVGLWEDGAERDTPDGYHRDFAVALCRSGFAVAAPEISCFGERQTDFSNLAMGQGAPTTCTHSAMMAFHLGISVAGIRVHDGLRLLDYLETREDVDASRVGAMGISGGGMHTFFSTCIDPRIRACVISGYYSEFRSSILAMSHCACNFVPGLWQFGEMHDLIGLIAPRPVLIEGGIRDPIFPVEAVRRGVEAARCVYSVFDSGDGNGVPEIETDLFEGRHRINGERAYPFLREQLGIERRKT